MANLLLKSEKKFGRLQSAIEEETLIGKANDAEVVELGDEVKCDKFATPEEMHKGALNKKMQIAIVGFWKKDRNEEYYCYNYFYVPNPCVREYARSERNIYIHSENSDLTKISIADVLFKGANDELFMIFNTSQIEHESVHPSLKPKNGDEWKLGLLNLEPRDVTSQPFPAHHYDAQQSFIGKIHAINEEVVDKIQVNIPVYTVGANPTIFSAFSEDEGFTDDLVLVVPNFEVTKTEKGKKVKTSG